MNVSEALFAQVMALAPWKIFARIIERHRGDAGVRTLGCADLFRVIAFAQLTRRESLRDIEVCLSANRGKLFHMGLKSVPVQSRPERSTSRIVATWIFSGFMACMRERFLCHARQEQDEWPARVLGTHRTQQRRALGAAHCPQCFYAARHTIPRTCSASRIPKRAGFWSFGPTARRGQFSKAADCRQPTEFKGYSATGLRPG